MILQYKHVERVVHDVKINGLWRKISNGDETAYAVRRSVGVKIHLCICINVDMCMFMKFADIVVKIIAVLTLTQLYVV